MEITSFLELMKTKKFVALFDRETLFIPHQSYRAAPDELYFNQNRAPHFFGEEEFCGFDTKEVTLARCLFRAAKRIGIELNWRIERHDEQTDKISAWAN
jgi:hypothetical protein